MPVPKYHEFMLPMLEILSDGQEHSLRELIDRVADRFNLTDAERKELLPTGAQSVLDNRAGWARTYLKKAGLIESPRRAHFVISDRGRSVLQRKPTVIDVRFLEQFSEFQAFKNKSNKTEEQVTQEEEEERTPDEIIEYEYSKMRESLAEELLKMVKSCSPVFFEQLVVDLLVKMGYGGSRKEAGQATKASGDEGIDGIIKEDRLGLDAIYLQAKRWENQVSRPEVQKFAGALQGQRARKGIFITTSNFSSGALEFCRNIESKIILIDGAELAKLMIDYNVGVSTDKVIELKKIDSDYFSGE
jgi:restriction system protein